MAKKSKRYVVSSVVIKERLDKSWEALAFNKDGEFLHSYVARTLDDAHLWSTANFGVEPEVKSLDSAR